MLFRSLEVFCDDEAQQHRTGGGNGRSHIGHGADHDRLKR